MDVTHISEFVRMSYVHVCINIFSRSLWATALAGETAGPVIHHLLGAFAVMGIKTDNGHVYTSHHFKTFITYFYIRHITGIEYNPQGQPIVERAHLTLKMQIKIEKEENVKTFTFVNKK